MHDEKSNSLLNKMIIQNNLEHTDLLTSLAHEIRSPLSGIVCFAQFLEEDLINKFKLDPAVHKELFENIEYIKSLGGESLEMMSDILEMKKIAKNGIASFPVNMKKEVNIDEVIKKSIKLNYSYYLGNRLNIKTKVEENLRARADEKRLKQVLVNLISNAVKYSPQNTTITIIADKDKETNKTNIRIIDQGFGMSKEQLNTVFDKFQTFKNPNSNHVDSFGIGLPLVKEMMEAQNGEIVINSQVGKGTEVWLKI